MSDILFLAFMTALGLAFHFLKHLAQSARNGKRVTIKEYWASHPYETALSLVGAVALFGVAVWMDQLNPMTAFLIGPMSNSAADIIGGRSKRVGGIL